MSMLIAGAMLGAGAMSTAGTLYANQQALKNTNKWNDVQIDLANTAHQREVMDLRAAGLNPILSASGSGAAVPSLGGTQFQNPGEGISNGINSAANVYSPQYKATVNNIRANTEKAHADTSAVKVHSDLVDQQRENEAIKADILRNERGSSMDKHFNTKLQEMAISEAITGRRRDGTGVIDWDDRDAVKTYNNLVEKYRNQIELERYMNSKERQMLLDGVNTAGSLKSLKSSKTVIHNHHLKGKK